jgi:hypothetical protein
MAPLKRWLFFPLALLLQWCLVFPFYALAIVIYLVYMRGRYPAKTLSDWPSQATRTDLDIISQCNDKLRDGHFITPPYGHGGLENHMLWALPEFRAHAEPGLEKLVDPNGAVRRSHDDHGRGVPVSGDTLTGWVTAYVVAGVKRPDLVRRIARHYLKHCFGLAHHENGKVTARCSNGGVNFCFDGAGGWGPPALGPQFYTSHALLSLAAKELGGAWRILKPLHWVFMGGWLFWIAPVLSMHLPDWLYSWARKHGKRWPKDELWYYTHHITIMNLHTIAKCEGPTLSIFWAMNWITKTVSPKGNCNPWFYAYAYDAGTMPYETARRVALRSVCAINQFHSFSPQRAPVDDKYFKEKVDEKDRLDSPGAFVLHMLGSRKEPGTSA